MGEAAAAYRRALHADPRSADAHFALGIALQALGDYGGATGAYEPAVQFQPDFADAFNNLGNCHQLCGDLRQAESAYRQALALRPNYADAMSNLGTVLQKMGQIDEAIELLRAAAELEPDVALHAVNLGLMPSAGNGTSPKRRPVLRRAARSRRKPMPKRHTTSATPSKGSDSCAKPPSQYRNATALRPDYADALNNLGNRPQGTGRIQARHGAAYEAAIRAQPDSVGRIEQLSVACCARWAASTRPK